jgi:hypothetical protein
MTFGSTHLKWTYGDLMSEDALAIDTGMNQKPRGFFGKNLG